MGLDNAQTGSRQLVSGIPEDTLLNQSLQTLGLSPAAADLLEMGAGLGVGAKASKLLEQSPSIIHGASTSSLLDGNGPVGLPALEKPAVAKAPVVGENGRALKKIEGFRGGKGKGVGSEGIVSPKTTSTKIDPVPPEQPAFPSGSVGASKIWSKAARLKDAQLPREGRIRYVPPDNWDGSAPLPRGPNKGFVDKFGNEWTKGPSRTEGQTFEWDVQLSSKGRSQIGWTTRDGSHANVSLDGKITHK